MPTYRQLDAAQIIVTIEVLHRRIGERFPHSNLRRVCEQLLMVARDVSATIRYLERPNWPIRAAAGVVIAVMLVLLVSVASLAIRDLNLSGSAVIQTIEAGVNDMIFFGIAVFFFVTIESRLKRRRALEVIHELRSLAHIVDMHQLTKDPERLLSAEPDTPSSPARGMTAPELGRYLDYCSELLSLISKLSALLVQHFNDNVVLIAVNEIEELTTGLSGKIWQKITILDRTRLER